MRQIVWNPHTNKPLNKSTLIKHFRRELTEGSHKLRAVLGQRWLDLICSKDDRVAWHAVECGLKYICGYNDSAPVVNMALNNNGDDNVMRIEFVNPPKVIDEPELVESYPRHGRPMPAPTLDNDTGKPSKPHINLRDKGWMHLGQKLQSHGLCDAQGADHNRR
jgi:hypothetical protein